MHIPEIPSWNVSTAEAVEIQKALSKRVLLKPLAKAVHRVAGIDVSYDRGSDHFHSAIVVFSFPEMEPVEMVTASSRVTFPYIPGFLSFREGPVVMEAFKKLIKKPHLLIFDGQGIAHPRRLGIASHLGVLLGIPSIGCAKSRLCGEYNEPGSEKGDSSPLKIGNDELGLVLRSKRGVKPLFVSPGHLIDVKGSKAMVLAATGKYRLPEPTRQAHLLVNRARVEMKKND
ncbi:MAG: deoxyribonuclease V [Deltaproteobacteria bacterium]|nr:deoxyribonuclease V [Deltaproteobacteria bacterium]